MVNSDQFTSQLLKFGEEDFIFSEQFNMLRARFEQETNESSKKLVGITSAISGEGKTLTSAILAFRLASSMSKKRILLIDMDLRKSSLSKGLGFEPSPGLSDYLMGFTEQKKIFRTTRMSDLYVIPAGKQIESISDLFGGARFQSILDVMREKFDIVLIDMPPILPIADTIALRKAIDAFILIYRASFTPYPLFKQALEELGNVHIMGVVLNGVIKRREDYYSGYYYK